ncbi:hypothetical protein B9Z19DRAFT_1130193 [Tuber borchii]|uniref:Uncharacterized protein n=1 Tax=Tuber borchii TaxID=42251 RepID=A0A2T6ZKY5_TUBBO|nr:hypothetical protein B9Z19DRAFT_1130193 [Tuber borchii]
MHGDAGSPVAASVKPAVGFARAATFGTSHMREPILGRTRFKNVFGRRNPGTNRPEGTHRSPLKLTGGADRTSRYQLTAEDMEGNLDITPVEWLFPNAEVYEDNSSGGSDKIYAEEIIYEEEEEEEEEETDYDGDNDNNEDYPDDREGERSCHSLSRSENGKVEMIGAGKTSGSSLGRASWDLDYTHSAACTRGLYGDAPEKRFRASTQEIEEWLLSRAMTSKNFFASSEDRRDRIKYIITKRKRLFASNACHIIDL